MRVFGLTGGIACGKSAVAKELRAIGVPVIDADMVAREVVAAGSPGLQALVEHFGKEILTSTGELDRPAMRARISRDPSAKAALDAITHPAIRSAIAARILALAAEGHGFAVVEAALMIESGSHRMYEGVLVVSCAPETQLDRLMKRDGMSEADAKALIATQMPLAEKERAANWVIRNDQDEIALREQVRSIWGTISAPQ